MIVRLFDVLVATIAIVLASPVLLFGAVGVHLSSPGPVFYRAQRSGLGGRPFTMLKLRSMHVRTDQGSAITAPNDARIFPLGSFLRKSKIDELPQFLNVILGDMSIVGPRPEDPRIVREHYKPWMMETLTVKPGVTSPATLFGYTHGDAYLDPADPEGSYAARQLPIKLAIEIAYLRHRTFGGDLLVIARTAAVIAQLLAGRREFPEPPEAEEARRFLAEEVDAVSSCGADEPVAP